MADATILLVGDVSVSREIGNPLATAMLLHHRITKNARDVPDMKADLELLEQQLQGTEALVRKAQSYRECCLCAVCREPNHD